MTEQELRAQEFFQGRFRGGIPQRPKDVLEEPTIYQGNTLFPNTLDGWVPPQFTRAQNPSNDPHGIQSELRKQLNDPSYGSLWSGMKDYGSKALDTIGEWAGNQGATEWAKIGLGIKDQFFDRPRILDSYLKQGSSLNALRGSQMAAIDANIAGANRAEARTTAMQLRNYNAQRPQGTPEKTQFTPPTLV
jgi:hypothetical protein